MQYVIQGIRVQEVEVPKVVYDEDVLIEVKAASLDPVDIKVKYRVQGVDELWYRNINKGLKKTDNVNNKLL